MSDTPAAPAVLIERLPDHVAQITLNRPDARNAVTGEVARGLHAAIDQTEAVDFNEGPRAFIEERAPRWTGR